MGRLNVITSGSLDRLASSLADNLAARPAAPLARETVVVLSTGMARWLSMELAASQGVCAGLDYHFPNEILDICFRALSPHIPSVSPFSRDTMAWRIAAALPPMLAKPAFEQINRYLRKGTDNRRLLQLSRVLADLFDQYTIFRPEMVLAWDSGRDDGWQSDLWRELSAGCSGLHRAALLAAFRERVTSGTVPHGIFPHRISLFGISYLPPFHLDAFSLLADHTEITFYLQNPCGAYWGDIVSRQRLAELALRTTVHSEEYYETGNPLLSSLGTMGQEFHDMLLEYGFQTSDLDREPCASADTLLGAVQSDIRELRDRGGRDEKLAVPAADRSLTIHSCHGPLREMETLYDNLLGFFEELDGLEPRHIVVMMPDIEAYAPYIAAVFGAQSGGRPAIPFTIVDRSRRRENPVVDIFLRILRLPASRFGVHQILELLESPPVMARFAISVDELETIREWVHETGVRWGYDRAHRAGLGFPPFAEFSWKAALDRLFLGYALAPDQDRLVAGILPFDAIEGRSALTLGKLAEFLRVAHDTTGKLSTRMTLAQWADTLAGIARDLILPENAEYGLKPLFDSLQTLTEAQEQSGFTIPVGLDAIQDCLTGLLDQPGEGYGFLGGRVTFCAMLPMRSIPFRVVCLAGMNDGIFPRSRRQPAFSLMSGSRRRGDRSLRDEDRYLFLETIMAAQDRLYISYTGQSDRDNSVIPPSVVVAELLDYVEAGFRIGNSDNRPAVLVKHRLQAFSTDYFTGTGEKSLFSYSPDYRDALLTRQTQGRSVHRFISEPLPDDPELLHTIQVKDLSRFLTDPSAVFLARRLGVRPYDPCTDVEEREAFALEGLTGYSLRQELVRLILEGKKPDGYFETARAKSMLPPGATGRAAFGEAVSKSTEFAQLLIPLLGRELEPLPIAFEHNGMSLGGTLDTIRSGLNLRWRCAAMKGRDRLTLWIEHLLLNALAPPGYPCESRLICNDLTMTLSPLSNAAEILRDLLELYREGLRRPLPFFPQVSWLFLKEGMERAKGRWNGTDHSPFPAESLEPVNCIVFNDNDPLSEEFRALAERIYGPLRAVAVEEKT